MAVKEHINLISREVLFREPSMDFRRLAVPAAAAGGLGVLVILSVWTVWQANALKKEVRVLSLQRDQARQELGTVQGSINLLAGTAPSPASGEGQRAAMSALLAGRITWSEVVREVSLLVPEGVWLTRLESEEGQPGGDPGGGSPKVIHFTGIARSQDAVNRFILALEHSPRYGRVSLGFVQKGAGAEAAALVSFDLTAPLQRL